VDAYPVIEDFIPDLAQFTLHSFDARPALYRGAMSRHMHILPTAETIDELLCLEALPPHCVRLTRSGQLLPRNAHSRLPEVPAGVPTVSVVDRSKVLKLFRAGATLAISDLEQVWPTAQALLRPFARTFACQTESVLFATPAGRSGFSPHADPISVVVVQSEGRKDWRVWPTDIGGPRTEMMYSDADLGEPLLQVTLEPGDVLYLPHGTAHAAAATETQSVHVSLGLRPRGWDDIISRLVSAQLSKSRTPAFPALTEQNIPQLAGELSRRLAELRDSLQSPDSQSALSTLRQELVSELAGEVTSGLSDMRDLDSFGSDQLFHVSIADLKILDRRDERCRVRIDGVVLSLPAVIVGNLTAKGYAARDITCREIYPGVSDERAMSVTRQLARIGALTVVPTEAYSDA
jgi:Cupin superfamily protein